MLPNLKYLDDADADLNEAEDSEGIFITIPIVVTHQLKCISVFAFSDDDDEAAENGEGGESESGGEIQRVVKFFYFLSP